MDRVEVYPQQILTDAEVLQTEKNGVVGLGHLARAVLGAGPVVAGLACAPTAPASMSVTIATGSIYALGTLDSSAYGSLGTDSSQVVKQGINSAIQTFSCPAPVTTGQSIVYLIEAAYTDNDTNNTVLTYFNSTNPAMPFTGPNNTGGSQPTVRQGLCSVNIVAGVPAATGSQTVPAATSGYTGLYTVTVAYGATTITSANIAQVGSAPVLNYTLPQLRPGFSSMQVFAASGTWSSPVGVTLVDVEMWSGGGGGGGGNGSNSIAPGGGGGAYRRSVLSVTPGTAYAVTVGAGGTPGTSAPTAGGTGGSTSFGALMSVTGGTGGAATGNGLNTTGAGAGGTGSGGTSGGTFAVNGIGGGLGFAATNASLGGIGGGTFGSSNASPSGSTGSGGTFPGGGGNGAVGIASGGTGAAGLLIVRW